MVYHMYVDLDYEHSEESRADTAQSSFIYLCVAALA